VAAGNIANSLLYNNNTASLIENAVGGSGNDSMTGNVADNKLTAATATTSSMAVPATTQQSIPGCKRTIRWSRTPTELDGHRPPFRQPRRHRHTQEHRIPQVLRQNRRRRNNDKYPTGGIRRHEDDERGYGLNTSVPVATDVDGTVGQYVLDTGVAKGQLTFNANGSYAFNPNGAFDSLAVGQTGQVSFTYMPSTTRALLRR